MLPNNNKYVGKNLYGLSVGRLWFGVCTLEHGSHMEDVFLGRLGLYFSTVIVFWGALSVTSLPILLRAYRLDRRMLRRKVVKWRRVLKDVFEFVRPSKKVYALETDKERFEREDLLRRVARLQPSLNFVRGQWRMRLLLLSIENRLLTMCGDALFMSLAAADTGSGFRYGPMLYFSIRGILSYVELRRGVAEVLATDKLTYAQLPTPRSSVNYNKGKPLFAAVYSGLMFGYLRKPKVCGADIQSCYYNTEHVGFRYGGCGIPCSEELYSDAQSAFGDTCLKEPLHIDIWLRQQIGVLTADQINAFLGCSRHFDEDNFVDFFAVVGGLFGVCLLYVCGNQTAHMFAPWYLPSNASRMGRYFLTSTDPIDMIADISDISVRLVFWTGLGLTGGSAVVLGIKALILLHEYRYGNMVLDRYNQQTPYVRIVLFEGGAD